jgi:HSP20 family protein
MTIVKWKSPFLNGQLEKPAGFNSPLTGLLEDLFGDDFFKTDFAAHMPAVNVSKEKDALHLELSAPGFSKEDFKAEVEDGVLNISGTHKADDESKDRTYYRKEFTYGSFKRSFNLPEEYNADNIAAKYENGILKVSVPKKEEIKTSSREISIQ